MTLEICNPQHIGQITHIDINTMTLICLNDVGKYEMINPNSKLVSLMEYANDTAEGLREINNQTNLLLENIEKTNPSSPNKPLFDQIEEAFRVYHSYIDSIKEKLFNRLKSNNVVSGPSLANELCSFAEETSLANINLKKAIINRDVIDIRKCIVSCYLGNFQAKFKYYKENLGNGNPSLQKGFDVYLIEPVRDPDLILKEVGISFVGFNQTSLKSLDYKDQFTSVSPDKFMLNNQQMPTQVGLTGRQILNDLRQQIPLDKREPNNFVGLRNANDNQNPFQINTGNIIDKGPIITQPDRFGSPYSGIQNPTSLKPQNRIDYRSTLHLYNRITREFLFYSTNMFTIFSIAVPNLSVFPYEGNFPSKYFNNNLFFSGGMNESQTLKVAFLIDLDQKNFIKKSDMKNSRGFHCIEEIEGNIIVLGGKSTKKEMNYCESYNPLSDKWSEIAPLNYPRANAISFILNRFICYIMGGNSMLNESSLIERRRFNENEKSWAVVQYRNIPNFYLPVLCANSCEIGEGRFLIFGGYSDKNLMTSCIYNANTDTIEKVMNLSGGYFILTNKSPSILENNEVKAIDESQKIHIFNLNNLEWGMFDTSRFRIIE